MVTLPNSLREWQSDAFVDTLQHEIESLRGGGVLPLDEVIGEGNQVLDSDLGVTVLAVAEEEGFIQARVGVYFAEIVSCCSCGESPPIDEAYCEMRVVIDQSTAEATFTMV
jgi:hypothetical protein